MDNENNFNDETLSKSQKNKNKLIIILIVVALIAVLGGVGVYAIVNSNPKLKVLNALKATSEDLKSKETLTQKIASKDYLKDLQKKGMNQEMKFTINSTDLKELADLNGVGISIDSSIDQTNKKLMFNIGGEYKGTSIAKAQFYTDNKKLMLSVPELYNAWFTCDAENVKEQYNNSYFAKNGQLLNKELSLKLFDDNDTKELSGEELVDTIVTGYLAANKEKLTTIGKSIKVEKSKETKKIEIDGTSQDCIGYDVVISGKDAEDFVESMYDYILVDPEVKKIITRSAKYSYLQENTKYNSTEEMIDDIYIEMKTASEEFKNSFTSEDVNSVVYLDKKGRAVSIELNTVINGDGGKVDIKYSSDFKGKDNIGDVIDMSMELSNNGEKIKIDLDNSNITKDDTITEEMKLVLSSNNEPFNISAKSLYNTKSGDFEALADFSMQDEGVTVSCNGNANFDKSSKKLALDFDKIDLKTKIDSEQINMSLDGSYSMAPLEKAIEEPTDEKLELFKLSEDKFATIVQEMQNNFMKIASAFM